jgi:hypothetical protein
MCIIAYKPQGIDFDETAIDRITDAWDANPDGAGIMYPSKGRVRIEKGFMTLDALMHRLESRRWENIPVVVHLRFATHGSIARGNTHPFPVTESYSDMRRSNFDTDIGIVHNGVIDLDNIKKGISDTMGFIAQYLAPLARYNVPVEQLADVASLTGSKFALMQPSGDTILVGKFHKLGGWYYSNDSYNWMREPATTANALAIVKDGADGAHDSGPSECEMCALVTGDVAWDPILETHSCWDCTDYYDSVSVAKFTA